jgi:LuxR family maltose regulon positive regulatory protein
MHFLETRLYPPLKEGSSIPRPAVEQALEEAHARKLTIIKAPAGYGKTSSLVSLHQQVVKQGSSVLWLSLYDFNGSWHELAQYLNHALLSRCAIDAKAHIEGLSQSEAEMALANALAAIAGPVYIFLDDLDAIHATLAEQFVNNLIKNSATNIHWIISSRGVPTLQLGRLRAHGQLAELEADSLRFSDAEAQQMLSLVSRRDVSKQLAAVDHARTEGWPAGLQLISIALSQSNTEETLLRRFSAETRGVNSFFSEEVFARLPADIQDFLLHTSVLGRFCSELGDAVTGRANSRLMMQKIETLGLFIFSLDSEQKWYRYHHLFADFLTRLLREQHPGLEALLHQRASDWFFANKLVSEAIQHAFASGNLQRAAELLDSSWQTLIATGVFSMAERWVAAIPEEILDNFPAMQLWRAWYLMCEYRLSEARSLLENVAVRLALLAASGTAEPLQMQTWQHTLQHRQLMLAQYSDDAITTERLHQSLPNACDDDRLIQGTTELALIYARREQYNLKDSESLSAHARELCLTSGKESSMLWHCCTVGPALVMKGETETAIEVYRNAIELGSRIDSDSSDFRAMPMLLLGDLLLERNEIDEARALFHRAIELGTGVGLVDNLLANFVGRARLATFDGDHTAAKELLREGFAVAAAKGLDRLRWHVVNERIKQALMQGDFASANRVAVDSGLPEAPETLQPGTGVTTKRETMALAWARLAIANGQHHQALLLLKKWSLFLASRGAVSAQVRIYILTARALHAAGDGRAALRTIHQAIALAAPAGLYFGFIEEGDPVWSLVTKALNIEEVQSGVADFAKRLKAALVAQVRAQPTPGTAHESSHGDIDNSAAPTQPLNAREIDILRYVARSLLNKEIADKLGLTEGSVKWYMQQIYGKLGVRRRMGALEKARLLGYLR